MSTEDLSGVVTMDLIGRLADPNKPYITVEEAFGQSYALFEFSSSSAPGSLLAKALKERPGVRVITDVEGQLNFTRFKVYVALDCLRPSDVIHIRREIARRAAGRAGIRAGVADTPPSQPEILFDGC